MTIGQKGQDGSSTGTGHIYLRPGDPFGPVVRSPTETNREARERCYAKKKERQDIFELLAGFPDLLGQASDRTPTDILRELAMEARGRRADAEASARRKAKDQAEAEAQAERDWFNS